MSLRKLRIHVKEENVYYGNIANHRNTRDSKWGCNGCAFFLQKQYLCGRNETPCEGFKRSDNKDVKFIKIK